MMIWCIPKTYFGFIPVPKAQLPQAFLGTSIIIPLKVL